MRLSMLPVGIAVILLGGCQESPPVTGESRPLFAVDLQTEFRHDSVRITLNNAIVFDDTATTLIPGALDLAVRITPSVDAGYHHVAVSVINLGVQADTTICVQDTTVLGVMLNRTSMRLSFVVFHNWVLYD